MASSLEVLRSFVRGTAAACAPIGSITNVAVVDLGKRYCILSSDGMRPEDCQLPGFSARSLVVADCRGGSAAETAERLVLHLIACGEPLGAKTGRITWQILQDLAVAPSYLKPAR